MIDGREFSYDQIERKGDELLVSIGGESYTLTYLGLGKDVCWVQDSQNNRVHLQLGSRSHWVAEKHDCQEGEEDREGRYRSPMPGKILKIFVKEGERVKKGQSLLILEAMKMEHTITAQTRGDVKKISGQEGEQVESDSVLIEIV